MAANKNKVISFATVNELLDALKDSLHCATDAELARALCIGQSRICNYRKGRCLPEIALARRMARILKVRPAAFIARVRGHRASGSNRN